MTLVLNEATTLCCAKPISSGPCNCGQHRYQGKVSSLPSYFGVRNSETPSEPAGGSLGGVLNQGFEPTAKHSEPVENSAPRTIVVNGDNGGPAGGALGLPGWNWAAKQQKQPAKQPSQQVANADGPTDGPLGLNRQWEF